MTDLNRTHWVDWESTDEYDTSVNTAVEKLWVRLQAQVKQLQSLEAEQLPEAVITEVVSQVVPPVVVALALAEAMYTSRAEPGTTMGPETPAPSEDMPLVLDADE